MTSSKRRRELVPWLFLAPFLLVFIAFLVTPIGYALYISLQKTAMIGGARFVGIENYVRVFNDGRFWAGVLNTLRYGIIITPLILLVSLALALALDSKHVMGKAVFRVGVFLPYAVPGVIAAVIWSYLYGPVFGPISQTSRALGMPAPPLLEEGWILFSLANITLWELAGYKMIIVYAALQAISGELEEAASLDGARSWQYALYVKVPLVMGAIVLNAVFSIIGTLQLFNEPSILKAMAPSVIPDHFTPNLYARALSFVGQEYNYAGAVSFTLAAVTAILSFILLWVVSRGRRASK